MRRNEIDGPEGHDACFVILFQRAKGEPCPGCAAAYERVKAELGPPPFPFVAWLRHLVGGDVRLRRHTSTS